MATVNTNPAAVASASYVDLNAMDIETALMTVQTQRAQLLENQLKDQLGAVQARNQQIEVLNSILAAVRAIRPGGKAEDKADTGNSATTIQMPATSTTGSDPAQLSKLQGEITALEQQIAALQGGGSTGGAGGTGGTGGTGGGAATITVPSTVKLPPSQNDAIKDEIKALNELIDANAKTGHDIDYASFAGGNGNTMSEFVTWATANEGVLKSMYGANFSLGFGEGSTQNEIGEKLRDRPQVRAALETYLRLAVQGNGTAAPPGTTILAPAGTPTASATSGLNANATTGTADPAQLAKLQAELLKKQQELQGLSSATSTQTTMVGKTLNQALQAYGFRSGNLSQSEFDQLIATITSKVDGHNSSQQMDMLRLQSLTNKRNEAFDLMTNFLKKSQDSRSSIVGNMR